MTVGRLPLMVPSPNDERIGDKSASRHPRFIDAHPTALRSQLASTTGRLILNSGMVSSSPVAAAR